MPTGGAQFVFQAAAFACEKDISSVYNYFSVSHRLASFPEHYQECKLRCLIKP
jgi:hypothetical protein